MDDIDTSLLLKEKGWRIIYCGQGVILHKHSATRKDNPEQQERVAENKKRFGERWGEILSRPLPPVKVWTIGGD